MPELDILEEAGLSAAEAKVYLALLETGSTLAGPVIKKTGLHRATTYQVLQRLKEKGLVSSVIRGKKQSFEAVDPQCLLDVLKEREESLQHILPALKARSVFAREKQEVTVYTGVKGIRSVLDRMLDELSPGGQYYDFGVSGLFRKVMGPYWDLWQKRKKAGRIKSYVIFNSSLKKTDPQLLKDFIGKARFHPEEFSSITDTMIYKDTIVLFIWTARPPIAIVIRNKDNARSYQNQFKLMWKFAKA